MDDKTYNEITVGLRESIRRFRRCKVASCDCNEYGGEWQPGCFCAGHWFALDDAFGSDKGDWSYADAAASAKVGKPVRSES